MDHMDDEKSRKGYIRQPFFQDAPALNTDPTQRSHLVPLFHKRIPDSPGMQRMQDIQDAPALRTMARQCPIRWYKEIPNRSRRHCMSEFWEISELRTSPRQALSFGGIKGFHANQEGNAYVDFREYLHCIGVQDSTPIPFHRKTPDS